MTHLMHRCTWSSDQPSRFQLPIPESERGPRKVLLLVPHRPEMCAYHDFMAHLQQFVREPKDPWSPVEVGPRDLEWEARAAARQLKHRQASERLGATVHDSELLKIEEMMLKRSSKRRGERRTVHIDPDARIPELAHGSHNSSLQTPISPALATPCSATYINVKILDPSSSTPPSPLSRSEIILPNFNESIMSAHSLASKTSTAQLHSSLRRLQNPI